jgi:hypothetical protein
MPTLDSTQRRKLEKAVINARELSLKGAVNALRAFAVHHHEPFSHMGIEDRSLRNKLREKARLLGDNTKSDGGHTIGKLAYDLAYEYWHRMLFARFLEANNLLIHPEHQIPVTLEECEELCAEEGHDDKWKAAAHYASKMLPNIFRQDDPLMKLRYATEDRLALEELIESITKAVFQAEDSLGWVYQYWQSAEKERINAEGNKIDGDSIAAVTQLFTEPYMVHFLIDNTLGAWWTARNPGVIPPVKFKYLRTLEDGTPVAGSFEGWPSELKDITILDPCMGSGHFVVDVFSVMARLRMNDENITKEQACDAVIKENIHGLEIDDRCTQIAAFNLALTSWKFCGRYRELPEMNLACCGLAPAGKKGDWIKLANAEQNPAKRTRLKGGLAGLYELFQQAPELGSLIDPTTIEKDAFTSDYEELQPYLELALNKGNGDNMDERAVIAAGLSKAGKILSSKFNVIMTNFPFLGSNHSSNVLNEFYDYTFNLNIPDLYVALILRTHRMLANNYNLAFVIPHYWMRLKTFKSFRKEILKHHSIDIIADLGSGAFSNISGEVVKVGLYVLSHKKVVNTSYFFELHDKFKISEKINGLQKVKESRINQIDFEKDSTNAIVNLDRDISDLFGNYINCYKGLDRADVSSFVRNIWECSGFEEWEYLNTSFNESRYFNGYDECISKILLTKYSIEHNVAIRGKKAWHNPGILVTHTGNLPVSLYSGNYFNTNVHTIIPKTRGVSLEAILCFCMSERFHKLVRKLDTKIGVTNAVFERIPFNLEYWQKVAEKKYPSGLPKPYSNDSTQWLFHGHPLYTESPLQVTIARLVGYQWPAENDREMELSDEAKEKIRAIEKLDLPFDEDGIVCIPPVNGEASAVERLRQNIIKIWGDRYNSTTILDLILQEGSKKRDLETYLRGDFFAHHCKLFKNRPFIWHIWDGRKDGFAALVNYQQLDKATLEKLIYTYLGDWINQCELKLQSNMSGADGLLLAAKALKEKLLLILEGEPPYDLFIRWKSLADQPLGWDPDTNDGVRLNIYPFVKAGVLRKKFNVKWGKDRGKNPSGNHWGPDRWNRYEDLEDQWKLKDEHGNIIPHLINDVKRKTR